MFTTRRLPRLAILIAAAVALLQGAAAATAQSDPLSIEKDGTVKVGKSLEVGGDVKATSYSGKGAVPVGAILMWSGPRDQLPAGWVFCDGANGTPDLSGRFIVGHDLGQADYGEIGNTGGEKQVTLTTAQMPAHTHAASTDKAGEHEHTLSKTTYGWDYGDAVQSGDTRKGTSIARTSKAGAHTHAVTVASAGGGQPHENRPPYYVLAYIMYKGFSVPAGTYLGSCRKAERSSGDILQAECRQLDGTWKSSRLDLNACKENIANNNGQLTCVKQ